MLCVALALVPLTAHAQDSPGFLGGPGSGGPGSGGPGSGGAGSPSLRLPDLGGGTASAATTGNVNYYIDIQISPFASADTIRVEMEFVSQAGPTTADRNFQISLQPERGGFSPPQSAIAADLPWTVPEGTTRMRLARHVPKTSYGNEYRFRLTEDGRAASRPGLSFEGVLGDPIRRMYDTPDEAVLAESNARILWVNHDDPDVRTRSMRAWWLPAIAANQGLLQDESLASDGLFESGNLLLPSAVFQSRQPEQLPHDWRAYQGFDVIVIHRDRWVAMRESSSPAVIALDDWVAGGGIVMIRGHQDASTLPNPNDRRVISGEAFEPLIKPINDSLQAYRNPVTDGNLISQLPTQLRDQLEAIDDEFGTSDILLDGIQAMDMGMMQDVAPPLSPQQQTVYREIRASMKSYPASGIVAENGVRVQPILAGRMIHLPPREDDAVAVIDWKFLDEHLGWQRSGMLRRGVDPMLGSQRFFQWVVPGVAQPPVYTFMGLLGLFVILVGPVAYRKTMKAHRGYLMFFIAPALAVLTTLAMLTYGIIADGFGTQARIRQVTWLDGETGTAFTRARETYFAGIRPSAGLVFPPNADVTLFPDNEQRSWQDRLGDRSQIRGVVTVTEDSLRFNSLFLPSRQQRQFIVHQPRRDWGRVTASLVDNDSMTVASESVTPLREVILRADNGLYFAADELPAGGTVTAKPISSQDASKALGEMYKRQWLVSSLVRRGRTNTNSYRRETLDVLAEVQAQFAGTFKPLDGVIEAELQQRMQLGSGLPNGSFVAIAPLTEDALAIEGAVPKESIHLVMGDLP